MFDEQKQDDVDISVRCMVEALGLFLDEDVGIIVEAPEGESLKKYIVYKSEDTIRISEVKNNSKVEKGQMIYLYDGTFH